MNSQQELLNAIQTINADKNKTCDTPATVLRVEGDTVWVHIDGGADETPVQKTINCAEGDTVQVRISNGSAFLVGNASAPPTDDKTANVAHFVAEQAEAVATEAKEDVIVLEKVVDEDCVFKGGSNIKHLSSTMYQNANGVNIYNDTLAVGDSYAHIDGDSFDIKVATRAGEIDDANDGMYASFGREITIGSRKANKTIGQYSQVLGQDCEASGTYSQAYGYNCKAQGDSSHAEGYSSWCLGSGSHAEGFGSSAKGDNSHAEGYSTIAEGSSGAHAEGWSSYAKGNASHAEGNRSQAKGNWSHAQNLYTIAESECQTTLGKWNIPDGNDIFAVILGNGEDYDNQSNALCIDWNGNVRIAGEVQDMNGNSLLDEWAATASVTNGTVTFSNIDDSNNCGYEVYFNITNSSTNKNPTAQLSTISGEGTSSMSLTYTTDADSGIDNAKLRRIR